MTGESVVSLGSVNVDKTRQADEETLADLREEYDWFPGEGETVRVGEIPEAIAEGDYEIRHGGKGANQAVAAARAGAEAALVGRVGGDEGEYGVREELRASDVDDEGVETVADAETGKAYVFVDEEGNSNIAIIGGANDRVTADYVEGELDRLLSAAVVLLQNEIPVEAAERFLEAVEERSDPPTVILDPAPAEGVEPLIRPAVDVLTPNESEYEALADEIEGFEGVVVIKRGGEEIRVEGPESFSLSPPEVDPVDTTGAGDTLAGYLGAGFAAGDSLREAVETAMIAASLSTEIEGAREGIPTREAVESYRETTD